MHKRDFLRAVHATVTPRAYLEIGVDRGQGLACALPRTHVIGIDPNPSVRHRTSRKTRVVPVTSDDYFEENVFYPNRKAFDLMMVDGLHHAEQALRDVSNCERVSHSYSVLLIDDVLPPNERAARRQRLGSIWAGDVWKLIPTLFHFRPDLNIFITQCGPTGMAVVRGLNNQDTILRQREVIEFIRRLEYNTHYCPSGWPLIREEALLSELEGDRAASWKLIASINRIGRGCRNFEDRTVGALRRRIL